MDTTRSAQALLGAFFFGILFNAASAALVLYVIGHGSAIFRDGLRLVLIMFLASSAGWALVEFLATIIEPTAATTCQVAVIFSSVFDQLGRVFVEQYLVWAARTEGKKGLNAAPQVLVLGRFGVGMAFIGLTRSEFNPTCVPVSSVLPVAIIVVVLDVLILGLVAIQILSMGSAKGKKSITWVTIGLAIWTAMSVVFLLGMEANELVLKTTLPALGLAILVALVTVLSGTLVAPRGPPPRRPDSPTTRDLSSSDSADYPPSRYEDVKGINTMAMAAYVAQNDGAMPVSQMPGNAKKLAKGNVWSKATGGKLVISNPVLVEQEGMGNPLGRIPTIDLATAALNERERREKLAKRGSTLIAQRPAPQPPQVFGQDGLLAKEMSLKRKDVVPSTLADLERSVSTKTTKTTAGLSVEANASSTMSELSPGTEKMRRRSPHYPPAPPLPTTFQPVRPGEPIRIPIPRPRTPPESPKEPEPVKTPLQRRPTTGLPSNPRAQAMKPVTKEAANQRHETVMFVNNIVYDDPTVVNNIVQGASKTPTMALDSGESVVNRPRPIPRKGDKDRQVFPAELSPSQAGHKRSKSGGSITSRKSILQSTPGSPTQLPPLPPPPKSAGNPSRPLPNDTKSMTFDEKMDFLYTTPTSALSTTTSKRDSVVPEVPPLPATYMDTQGAEVAVPAEPDANSEKRLSKTTDGGSIRTTSILGIEDIPQRLTHKANDSRNAADELGQSWLPGISVGNERKSRSSRGNTKMNRKSSPVIPVGSHFSITTTKSDIKGRDDDATSVWGSVHSPVAAVDIQQTRLNARSTYIQNYPRGFEKQPERSIAANVSNEAPVVNLGGFHRRVGEECPSFSTRKTKGRLRKMPPPAPLILNGSKRAIIVQAAEPSPLESPEAAYQMIQDQLRRFEQPNRESIESQGQRLALLENLELEMGQIENKWQHRLSRDSMSSIQTSTSRGSRPPSIAERRASRRASMRSRVSQSKGESTGTSSSQSSGPSSENTRASVWQARLAEAQMEYTKSTPDLVMKLNNLNFLSVSKAALGSPSPPDTDESEYENEVTENVQVTLAPEVSETMVHELWKPQSPIQYSASSGLWAAVVKRPQTTGEVHELPSLSVRPALRKTREPLTIESSRLWQKPTAMNVSGAASGLWRKYVPAQISESDRASARPVTVRPPRRNKRMTLLPDILENPEPLPNKRGTLGLFQFPWGEKSENASVQPQPQPNRPFMAMPGTMTTGGPIMNASLDVRSRQLEAEEFTTSFFDDYEAEEDGDNFDDYLDSDGEADDFDESTLWEIASLLKSENVPSKYSLLPPPQQSPASVGSPASVDNITDMLLDDYREDVMVSEDPIPVDSSNLSTIKSVPTRSLLWTAEPEALEIHNVSLPQPDPATWKSYITEPTGKARPNSRIEDMVPLHSDKLWESTKDGKLVSTGLLWSAPKSTQNVPVKPLKTEKAATATKLASLWVRPVVTESSEMSGLFDVGHSRTDYRRTLKEPAAILAARKPRAIELPLEKLTSKTLWSGNATTKVQLMWEKPIVANVPQRDGLFDRNESRSDYRRTAMEPAALSMKKVPRAAKESLARLTTSSLWSKEATIAQSTLGAHLFVSKKVTATPKIRPASLWEEPKTTPKPEYKGLFDVTVTRNDYRRTSKIPAAFMMPTKPRASKEPLPPITTTSLWTGEQEAAIPTPELLAVVNETSSTALANLLWEEPVSVVSSSGDSGLFDITAVRADYRRTSKLPAAVNMIRKPRKTGEALPTLKSKNLWKKQPKLGHASTLKTASLWNKPTVKPSLFQSDPNRKVYRTTSAEPAALQMVRKVRLVKEPLPRIESARLWTSSHTTAVELDWITISSVRPRSPSVSSISTASSRPASPISDSSSVKTGTTKASSAKSTGSFFKGWFGRKRKGSEASQASEDSVQEATPDVPAIPELPEEFIVKNLDEVPRKKPARVPLRQSYRPSIAYRGDWEGALREAIVASYPGTMTALRASYPQEWETELQAAIKASHMSPKITRKAASPRDWSAALQAAIIASYPEVRFSRGQAIPAQWKAELQEAIAGSYPAQVVDADFDVTVRHPVFMGSLETDAEIIHPAMSPKMLKRRGSVKKQTENETTQTTSFDAVTRHTVFFNSMQFFGSMEATPKAVLPAMLNTNVSAPLLWTKQSKATTTATNGLWAPECSSPKTQTAIFSVAETEMVGRKQRITRSTELSVESDFGEQGMWRRNSTQSHKRDWLEDSMKKRFTRIELRY
ncbi:hypothetical protein GGS26DRAFT_73064 [Hypomontagnella submonticulosa]|nr:hypothetical protein GGS26DRAFT_73064 [Hypomontagnella submonticulosa]